MSSGTVITGFPRSGTTLALRVLCSGLRPGDMTAGGVVNEPQALSKAIDDGTREGLDKLLEDVLDNDFGVVKHPFASLILGSISPRFKVLMVFRDLREVACSVFAHHNRESVVGKRNSWMNWGKFDKSMSHFERIAEAWKTAHLTAVSYDGEMEVWNYGFWDEWSIVNTDIRYTYPDPRESSGEVIMDVMAGKTFSDRKCGRTAWDSLTAAGIVGHREEKLALEVIDEVMQAYKARDIVVKSRC